MSISNTAHLAGEFLVAGELSRRGYPVSITIGNAKSVDIYAEAEQTVIKIDAKASRLKTSWPIFEKAVRNDIFYIFVNLRTVKEVDKKLAPEYFIVKGEEILSNKLINTNWRSMQGILYSTLNTEEYRERWDKLPSPRS